MSGSPDIEHVYEKLYQKEAENNKNNNNNNKSSKNYELSLNNLNLG